MSNIGVLLAGGIGSRFESVVPKQYMKLNGEEIISYSIEAFNQSKYIDKLIVVVGSEEYQNKSLEEKYDVEIIRGGDTRNISLYNAINYIQENYPDCTKLFIHEAARPFLTSKIIDTYLQLLDDADGVITSSPITDSLGYKNNTYVDRDDYILIQAPECFWFNSLKEYFNPNSIITGTVHQLPDSAKIIKYEGFKYNLKITYPYDLFLAEQFSKIKFYQDAKQLKVGNKKKKRYLIFGGSGGIGQTLIKYLEHHEIEFKAPTSQELDLRKINIEILEDYLDGFIPDVIINTAGAYANDKDGILQHYDSIMDVNLKSNLILLEYARQLKKRVNVVLISSSSSTKGRKNLTVYSASKVALNSIVESLAEELNENDVTVNVIVPEKVNTPLIDRLHTETVIKQEMLQTEDVVKAILYYSYCEEYGQLIHLRKGMS